MKRQVLKEQVLNIPKKENDMSSEEFENLTWEKQMVCVLQQMVECENPQVEKDEKIAFKRTIGHMDYPIPKKYLQEEKESNTRLIGNRVHNFTPDWKLVLSDGLYTRLQVAKQAKIKYSNDCEKVVYLDTVIEALEIGVSFVEKYKMAALQSGNNEMYQLLSRVPFYGAYSFHEALQSIRFIYGLLWMNGHNHIGFGRFDQYMWPYLQHDLQNNVIDEQEALELIEEFFLSINKDSKVYPGIQKGDNGQTLMLGGSDKNGRSSENKLTYMVLKAAADVALLEPKINLRICSDSSDYLLSLAAELGKQGMPQYSNDDVIIPALVKKGYAYEDALEYTVAACWEFIIPGKGMDVPNVNALSFLAETDIAIRKGLKEGFEFEEILDEIKENIKGRVRNYVLDKQYIKYWAPSPFASAFMTDCIERGIDINRGGAKYVNYGIHGSGISNAADSLAAIKKLIYDDQVITKADYLCAIEHNWEEFDDLRKIIQEEVPKAGNNDSEVDRYIKILFDYFADSCDEYDGLLMKYGKKIYIRPGSGSAMYYLWLIKNCNRKQLEPIVGATADGRKEGDYLSANLAPSIGCQTKGVMSILGSFSNIDYSRICNGGPITIELMPQYVDTKKGKDQIINIVKCLLASKNQQLQVNCVDPETLRKAQKMPENYRDLVVKVWGWSGYFVELSKEYQDQIISRCSYNRL